MLNIFILLLVVLAFYNVNLAWIFVVFSGALMLYLYYTQFFASRPEYSGDLKKLFTKSEFEVVKKYHLYFSFPFTSRILSSASSGITIGGAVVFLWSLWEKSWLIAILSLIVSILATLIAPKLNPRLYLHEEAKKRNDGELQIEMILVDSICEKIEKDQEEKAKIST